MPALSLTGRIAGGPLAILNTKWALLRGSTHIAHRGGAPDHSASRSLNRGQLFVGRALAGLQANAVLFLFNFQVCNDPKRLGGLASVQNTLLIAGLACLIAAVVGGGLKAFGIEIPLLASPFRQVTLGVLGAVIIAVGATQNHSKSGVVTTDTIDNSVTSGSSPVPNNTAASVPPQPSSTAVSIPAPRAVNATITFDTTTDNKDDDSYLSVVVRDALGRQLFQYSQVGKEEFKAPSSITKILHRDADILKSSLAGGSAEVCITTTGNDTWNFNYHGTVISDDNTSSRFGSTGQVLSGHNSTQCTSASF